MSFFILGLVLFLSFGFVKVAAMLLELTGMDPRWAQFQALNAFTGTGFTTREAERVVKHPFRRTLIMVLMILGNAGVVGIIASVIIGFTRTANDLRAALWLAFVVLFMSLLFIRIHRSKLMDRLSERLKKRLIRSELVPSTYIEKVLEEVEGYGVFRILVDQSSPQINKTLAELQATQKDVLIMAIQRNENLNPVPKGYDIILPGDTLVCFGKIKSIESLFLKAQVSRSERVA